MKESRGFLVFYFWKNSKESWRFFTSCSCKNLKEFCSFLVFTFERIQKNLEGPWSITFERCENNLRSSQCFVFGTILSTPRVVFLKEFKRILRAVAHLTYFREIVKNFKALGVLFLKESWKPLMFYFWKILKIKGLLVFYFWKKLMGFWCFICEKFREYLGLPVFYFWRLSRVV